MAGKTPGMNPAESFQKDFPTTTVINCAVGGTSISEWAFNGQLDGDCYNAVLRTKLPVIGILWYQGEADAALGTTDWDQSFNTLIRQWRGRYGNVPLVFAQLASHDPIKYPAPTWDLIKSQQASLSISDSRMVVTDDLPRQDEVHLTGPAAETVGHRMSAAFGELLSGGN